MPPSFKKFVLNAENRKRLTKLKIVFFDFDGVFTNNTVLVTDNGNELAQCSRFDGFGLKLLRGNGTLTYIISTEPNPIVWHRSKKLEIPCAYNVSCKVTKASEILKSHNLTFEQSIFVGNDVNDIDLMERVNISIAVRDAWPTVLEKADAVTDRHGGFGAVREVAEIINGVLRR